MPATQARADIGGCAALTLGNLMYALTDALLFNWPWRPVTTFLLLTMAALYVWGWQRSRRAYPSLATPARLFSFWVGWLAVALALVSPLYALHGELLAARAAQQILLGIVAPPLLWLACPFHVVVWGMPAALRKWVTRRVLLRTPSGKVSRFVTKPVFAWLGTVSIFLIWHEPQVVAWTLAHDGVYDLTLGLFLGFYMLFWWHLVGTAPRIHAALPGWMAFLYIVLGGELPNMVTGVTLAFQESPTYLAYAQSSFPGFTSLQDQMVSGGMIWLIGSLAYVSTAIILLGRFFKPDDTPPRLPFHFDATERTIAPGLEHRVLPQTMRQRDARNL